MRRTFWSVVAAAAKNLNRLAENKRALELLSESYRVLVTTTKSEADSTLSQEAVPEMIRDLTKERDYWKREANRNWNEYAATRRAAAAWKECARRWRDRYNSESDLELERMELRV